MKGKFITFEGCEGVGKSTQLRLIREYLEKTNQNVVFTREPGGTPLAEKIRNIILTENMCAETEAELFAAARCDHIRNLILPALNDGKTVICDRFVDSSLAYQGYGRNLGYERVKDINPEIVVDARKSYYDAESAGEFDFASFDYIADCIDSVTSKILIAENADKCGTPVISCMGTGNKLFQRFEVADIYETTECPLAKVMRRELKKRGISKLKVVYSKEKPRKPLLEIESNRRQTPASISFVPPTAGFILAGEIIRDIIGENEEK